MSDLDPASAGRHPGLLFAEFVALMAALMALNALAIDLMLPALPHLDAAFALTDDNQRQTVIVSYLMGMGFGQLIYGPMSDRFGRRSMLLLGLVLFIVAGLVSTAATSFGAMVAARVIQGLGASASRVIALAVVRDCYEGRAMGKVISLIMMVFMIVPIVAPTLGQLVLLVAPWRWVFGVLVVGGVAVLGWVAWRLPETLPVERRSGLAPSVILRNYRTTLTTRQTLGYMMAMAIVMGALFGFVTSAQQVFNDALGVGRWFTLLFSIPAGAMAVAAFANSRLVMRLGMRALSHYALIGFTAVSALHLAIALAGGESTPVFVGLLTVTLFLFGFIGANFSALALEPLGHIAGTASSMMGFFSTTGSAALGFLIGQAFDGTVVPFTAGFTLYGVAALVVVLVTERGKLGRPGPHA